MTTRITYLPSPAAYERMTRTERAVAKTKAAGRRIPERG